MKNIIQIISCLVAFSATSHALVTVSAVQNDGATRGSYSISTAAPLPANQVISITPGVSSISVGTNSISDLYSGIIAFQLPSWETLDPGAAFSRASLNVRIDNFDVNNNGGNPIRPGNARLEILRYGAATPNVNINDYNAAALPGGTLNNFLIDGTHNDNSNAVEQNLITNFINANGGYVAGNYLVMRISLQADPGAFNMVRYLLGASPTLTVVPEPSTYALIAGSIILGVCMLRRRKKA